MTNGFIIDWKARAVVDGSQMPENSLYAPVVNSANMRLVLSHAVRNNWYIHVLDLKNAYLNSELNDDVYMYQIEMYENEQYPNCVCKLNKSLYGLPQSAYNWYQTVKITFEELSLVQFNRSMHLF